MDHFHIPKRGNPYHTVQNVTGVTCIIRVATYFAASEVLMNEMIPTLYASSLLLEERIL